MKKIWRTKYEQLDEQNIHCTVKHGGGLVKLDFIDTTMNAQWYVNRLEKNIELTFCSIFDSPNATNNISNVVALKNFFLHNT